MSTRQSALSIARLAARYPCRRTLATAARSAEQVRIVEVGPRDGLQNEKKAIELETKIEFIKRLAQTGLRTIEAGSFVSPKWVPQMANSSDILEHILQQPPQAPEPINYQFLLPNSYGLGNFLKVYKHYGDSAQPAADTGYPTPPPSPSPSDNGPALNTSSQDANAMPSATDPTAAMSQPVNSSPSSSSSSSSTLPEIELSIFTAATETFTQKNINCSIAESLERFKPIFGAGKEYRLRVRAYISVALGCPFEGPDVDPHQVADLAVSLLEMGAHEISVADTTGMGTAPKTQELLKTLKAAGVDAGDLALHFHDTYGMALVNTVVGLDHGVRTFDASVAGLGGCPYSPGATGNVGSEDMVHLCHSLGLKTGVDIEKLSRVGDWIAGEVGKANESRAGKATIARLKRDS
ncbi:hypothetical protein W97_07133 [Coniosporium apollinis CBS 100218]|uniref:hydroxymethylglutaryl-CoA lyase n=1 Tax=Coniosporium apollinis (strain CBS 100218) TaxID=1168221 RepID=R7Z1F8_CONA1|nr:uncharacterized protein W97_07133 [Coniosporium apollinis CBS 100218]EON67987.1 hypothetical protein W97_07133 [Coniosporium apollinis CBS 100218]